MLARKDLPPEYVEWNERWGAPYGRNLGDTTIPQRLARADAERYGPFGFQISNHTRRFEYPWAYFSTGPAPGLRVLDVGGGLSGLQIVLALAGCDVVNVDPEAAQEERSWSQHHTFGTPLTRARHDRLNEIFGTRVRLVPEKVQDGGLPSASFDRILCLSVIEHVDPAEASAMLKAIEDLLVPGGTAILTVDLFLDVVPFGVLTRNTWGTNIDVRELVESVDLELVAGIPAQLHGFAEFDREHVVALLPELLIGHFSALTQALVLRKRA